LLTIRAIILSGIALIASLFIVLAMVSITEGQNFIEQSVGKSSLLLGEDMAKFIEFGFSTKIDDLNDFSKTELVRRTLLESNQEFDNLSDIQGYIDQQEDAWVSVPDETITPFMQSLISNELAKNLRENFVEKINVNTGHSAFAEVFLTNEYGANVAQSGKTSDYRQDDEEWWLTAKANGISIGKTEYDQSAKTAGIPIGIKIMDKNGDFLGILKGIISVRSIIREAEIFTQYDDTTQVNIITTSGNLIYSTKTFRFNEDISDLVYFNKLQTNEQRGFFITDGKSKTELVTFVKPTTFEVVGGQDWIILIKHEIGKVGILSGITTLRENIVIASTIIVGIGLVLGIAFSSAISRAVAKLIYLTREISEENFDVKVNLKNRGELTELADNMSKMGQALKTAKKEKEEFVAMLSHDLKQPLVPIQGNAEMLGMPQMGELNKMQKECVSEIAINVSRQLSMIDNLVSAQKLGAGAMKFDIEELSSKTILKECIKTHTPAMMDKNLEYFDSSTIDVKIKGDNRRIHESFTNLILNAHDFTPKKGKIEIGVNDGEKEVTFFVKDNGEGIPKEKQSKLFKKYGQVKSDAKRKYGGTGLGLAVSQQLVEGMKGKIWLESEEGKGTTFFFTIPKAGITP